MHWGVNLPNGKLLSKGLACGWRTKNKKAPPKRGLFAHARRESQRFAVCPMAIPAMIVFWMLEVPSTTW